MRPARQSALACSRRSFDEATKFHSMKRSPTGSPPSSMTVAGVSARKAIVSPGAGVDADEHAGYALTGLTPNPTGGAVAVGYTLGRPGRAVVAVYDPSGALVATLADEMQGAGEHRAAWDASGAAAGIYYCRITSGGWSAVRPIVVVR